LPQPRCHTGEQIRAIDQFEFSLLDASGVLPNRFHAVAVRRCAGGMRELRNVRQWLTRLASEPPERAKVQVLVDHHPYHAAARVLCEAAGYGLSARLAAEDRGLELNVSGDLPIGYDDVVPETIHLRSEEIYVNVGAPELPEEFAGEQVFNELLALHGLLEVAFIGDIVDGSWFRT
jgi:hypothetical protein